MTYRELRDEVLRTCGMLREKNVSKGDRIAVLLPNGIEFLTLFFAVASVGAIIVPLNTRLHPTEHVQLLQHCKPVLMLADRDYGASIVAVRRDVHSVTEIIAIGAPGGRDGFDCWIKLYSPHPLDRLPLQGDPAAILYTSGTTSAPKGATLTHGNYLADLTNVSTAIGVTSSDVNLQLSPLYHAAAVHTFAHLLAGATTVLSAQLDPTRILQSVQAYKVTYVFAVPTLLYQLIDHPRLGEFDLSSLRLVSYGAAAMLGVRLEQAMHAFRGQLLHAYGLTECTSHASVLGPAGHKTTPGSIGKGMEGTSLRVVDENGAEVGPGGVGEILVKGGNVMHGYWRQEDATAETIRNGWLHTGDLARVDSRGFLYVVDRKKDMVISGGVNIYPREVEEVLARHPAVAEIAVYGVPDPHWGESLAAAIVLKPGMAAVPAEFVELARTKLARYKIPKLVEIVESLPKTGSGKVRKIELRRAASKPAQA
jgi:acyl-CoA synthetase (AMP-forming)/AMP-acid ligase II